MFDHKHYVPILAGKAGEYRALRDLTPARKASLTPLIELPPVPYDFANDRPACTIDVHVEGTGKILEDHWGREDPLFIDLFTVEDEGNLATGEHPLTFVLADARGRGVQTVPVTGLDRDGDYQAAVRAGAAADGRGAVLRLTTEDITDRPDLPADIDALLATLGLASAQMHLLIDLGPLLAIHEGTYFLSARNAIASMPHLGDWLSFTLAGAAFPEDTTTFRKDSVSTAPRTDWRVWLRLAAVRGACGRMPAFGDYAIDAPGHNQLDFRIIKMNAAIRYTHESNWIVVKGHVIKKGIPTQYPGLAVVLHGLPEYSGAAFSAGDRYIDECAAGRCGPGNATTWRQVGVNHHLSFVVDQIARTAGL